MKKRVILTTVVAFLLLAAAIAAGLNAVFTVTHVRADFTTHSQEGRAEAAELREKLDAFLGKSTTFLDLGEVRSVVEEYPCFRLCGIRKEYPTAVRVEIEERRETFAAALEGGGYAVYDEEGQPLYHLAENVNRTGGENILLEGFPLGDGQPFPEPLLLAMSAFREELTEIRANVLSVSLMSATSDSRNDFLRIRMREGVVIDLGNPAASPREKAELALIRYFGLTDEARIFGYITVLDGADGALVSDYSRNSRLE